MNRLPAFSMIAVSVVYAAFALAGCNADDRAQGDSLPQVGEPITFSTTVEELSSTRASVENTWTGNEEVAIEMDNEVRKYKPTGGGTSVTLKAATGVTPFKWQPDDGTKKVKAWYIGTGYSASMVNEWSVKSDQGGDGYEKSDLLYAETTIDPGDRNTASLTFQHETAKVVINIQKAGIVSDATQIASVSLVNMNTTAQFSVSGWSNHTNALEIIPKSITPSGNTLKSYAAIVIPQQMKGQQFIKIGVSGGKFYHYTPENDDANLAAGGQYTYNITVKKDYVEAVMALVNGVWTQEGGTVSVSVQ